MRYFKIYTERKTVIPVLASKYFDSFTLIDTIGYWKGQKEQSVIIELIIDDKDLVRLYALISDIKIICEQNRVLLVEIKNNIISFI